MFALLRKNQQVLGRFAFLTGVSKFSKVSLFSGLNNLNDISVDAEYSALCGYTEALLFQTGYLTIDSVRQLGALIQYRLRYPNLEARTSLNGALLDQIKDRGYSDKYRADGCPIHLIGVEFSRETRSVVGFEIEQTTSARR